MADAASCADAMDLVATSSLPARQVLDELKATLADNVTIVQQKPRIRFTVPTSAAHQLFHLTRVDRIYVSIGSWSIEQLPSPDNAALRPLLKALVGGRGHWDSALLAWRAVHASGAMATKSEAQCKLDPQSEGEARLRLRVIGKRSGRRYAALGSLELGGSIGAELASRFDLDVDLKTPNLEVSVLLNDTGLFVSLALLRRPCALDAALVYGLHPHVAWALQHTAAKDCDRAVVLDPMCGTGTVLLELVLGRSDVLAIGLELCASQLDIAKSNRARLFQSAAGRIELVHGDATRLPMADESVDAVVCDLPFGRMHGSEEENVTLYPAVVYEVARVLRKGGKAVLLTNGANVQCLLSAFGHVTPKADFEAARATQPTESSTGDETDRHQDVKTQCEDVFDAVGGGSSAAELINASSGGMSSEAPSLRLLYCRLLPLGNTEGWAFVAVRPVADFDENNLNGGVGAHIDAGAVGECDNGCGGLARDAFESSSLLNGTARTGLATTRFEWEEQKGRSSWEAKRKSHRPALVPVGSRA